MATAEQYAEWIIANQDKKGTPEFETVAAAYRMARGQVKKAREPNDLELANPTDGMSGLDKFRAGIGKAFVDLGRGVGQIAGVVDQKDVDEAKRLDSSLMDTGAGFAGNLVGNLVPAAATAAIPGANTVVGGAALSGVLGALQPVGSTDSRLGNAALSTILGGTIPAAIRLYGATKAAVIDPFSSAGRDRIAGGVMRDVAADPDAAFQNLINAQGKTAGFMPTAGQAANDAGIATLERTAKAIDPGGYDDVLASQRKSLADAVRGLGGDDVTISGMKDARDAAAESLYGKAMQSDAMRVDLANQQSQQLKSVMQGSPVNVSDISASAGVKELMSRPAFRAAMNDGKTLASNLGEDFAPNSLQSLHYAKLAIDDALNGKAGAGSALANHSKSALQQIKQKLLAEMETLSPAYRNARLSYQDMSKPINSAEVGNALGEKFIPALYRDMDAPLSLNYDALARAVRNNGDDIARNVTGYKKATLGGTLGGKEMKVLNDVLSDAEMVKMGELLGKGGGSDTIQKMAMSNVLNKAGVPTFMQDLAMTGWVKRAGDLLYGNADEQVRNRLAEALRNPKEAAQLMKAAGVAPSKIAQALKALSSAAQAPMFALPAIMNAE